MPVHPLQGEADEGALQRIRLPERLVQSGDAGDVAAHRSRGLDARHVVDEGDQGSGAGGQRRQDVPPAPGRKYLHVRPQRPLRVAAEGTPGRFEVDGQLVPHLRGVFNADQNLQIGSRG